MKVDTHVHLLVNKVAPPDWDEIAFILSAARADGLDVLCICEHLDAAHYSTLMDGIFQSQVLEGQPIRPGVFRLESGLIVSAGAEVSVRGGGDVGIHTTPDVLLSLNRTKGHYSLPELLDALDATGAEFAAVAHHVYFGKKWIGELPSVKDRMNAVELPAKDLAARDRYVSLADELGLPMVGGGDGHTWLQVGTCFTELSDPELGAAEDFTIAGLKAALARGHTRPISTPGAERFIRMSKLYRGRLETQAA